MPFHGRYLPFLLLENRIARDIFSVVRETHMLQQFCFCNMYQIFCRLSYFSSQLPFEVHKIFFREKIAESDHNGK